MERFEYRDSVIEKEHVRELPGKRKRTRIIITFLGFLVFMTALYFLLANMLAPIIYEGKTVLDFRDAQNFDSAEEAQQYYFRMDANVEYRVQTYYTYRYDGHGCIIEEAVLFLGKYRAYHRIQENQTLQLGYPTEKGRYYIVTIKHINPDFIILKIVYIGEEKGE